MTTFTNLSKNSASASNVSKNAASASNVSKNSVSPSDVSKNTVSTRSNVYTGRGWHYNQPSITYNGLTDTDTGNAVKYNLEGDEVLFSNLSKS